MRCGAAWLALGAAILAGPVAAQSNDFRIPSLVTDPTIVSRCVARTANPLDCLGAMTEVCREENDIHNFNLEERRCVIAEYHVWNDLAGVEAAAIAERAQKVPDADHDQLIGPPAAAFARAETAWQDWSRAHCDALRALAGRDPRRAIIADTCLRDLAAERFARLVKANALFGLK